MNAAIGGLTAGILQAHRDGSFWNGLWRGALGGAGTFAGKALVAEQFAGAGTLGRLVAATGASVTRNAAENRPTFERLILPIGPVRLHWRPAQRQLHASLDVVATGSFIGSYVAGIGASLDVGRSLDSGAAVFHARDWEPAWGWHGRHVGGSILLRGDRFPALDHDAFMRGVLAHERVHLIQYDQAYILWSEPVERHILLALGASARTAHALDLSLQSALVFGLNSIIPSRNRPWEREADLLSGTFRNPRGF